MKPETKEAVDLVLNEGLTPYAAATRTAIALSTIYRALKRNYPQYKNPRAKEKRK